MKHYSIKGKPTRINWTLHSIAGEEFSLMGYTYRLYYSNGTSRGLATGVTHVDNVLTWDFVPGMQWKNGYYDIAVELYSSGNKIITVTYPQAFLLLQNAHDALTLVLDENDEYETINSANQDDVATLNILSYCDFNRFVPLAPVIGSDGKWYIDGQVVLDDNDNPVYADSTIDIEEDGTITVNKDRHNEYTITSLKDALTLAATDHGTAASDHTTASSDHTTAASDHTTAAADHSTAVSDHLTAVADHTTAASDHNTALENNTAAAADHAVAEADHATAASDHTIASSDHATAIADHNSYLGIEANIPTEATVAGWGFTKNTGDYSKPDGGIPKSDLDSTVQASLGKADTALQSFTETDPTVPSWAKESTKPSYSYSEISGTPTLATVATSGSYSDLSNTPDLSDFITKSVNDLTYYYLKTETYSQTEVNSLIGAINQFRYEIAASTSAVTSPASNVLYLIGPIGSGADKYEEYVYPDSTTGWVKIGDTSIDLSGYVTTSALNTALADYTTTTDLTTLLGGKADKVSGATSGNFAGLDSNGNLVDSGHKHSDYLTSHQDISGKEDTSNKVSSWSSTTTDTHYPSEKLVKDSLDAKQDQLYYDNIVGRMYRNNVSGSGNISINGTSGQFPTVTTAGTYTVEVTMTSATASYGLNVTFGSNTYSLTTTNGTISDSRELTIAANSSWSAAVVGSVANGTIIEVRIIASAVKVTTVGKTAVTNSYKDLFDQPSIPSISGLESASNKVSTLTGYETNTTKYPNTKAVYDAIAALPSPMVFQGTIGTSGTTSTVPSSPTEGDTYKIIEGGTSLSFPGISDTIKVGDTVVYKNSTIGWVLIPSGDEPSGTVTSVTIKGTSPIVLDSESAISTSGTRTVSHADSGVTAGTYKSVTVDAKGHVTAGSNPTTLGGYGITDAKIDNGVITLGSNSITPLTQHQDISGKQDTPLETTWSALKSLRDGGTLEAGRLYRITDYVATTVQTDSRSANHPFDIIVEAISTTALSEEARAALHSGDTYFSGSRLEAWELRYCLDNNTNKFSWADSTNGKGVVYRMVDEYGNDVPYDFKGIQFKRYEVASTSFAGFNDLVGKSIALSSYQKLTVDTNSYVWYYTFSLMGSTWTSSVSDASLNGMAANIVFTDPKEWDSYSIGMSLLNNVFGYGPIVSDFLKTKDGDTSGYSAQSFAADIRFEGFSCNNNTFIGWSGLSGTMGGFRRNLIVGSFRHIVAGTNVQDNTIFNWNDFSFSNLGHGFEGNALSVRKIGSITFEQYCQYNTISGTQLYHVTFGKLFAQNTLSNTYMHSCSFDGQTNNNTFNGDFRACTFTAYVSSTDFTGGTYGSTIFYGVDFKGGARGSSNSRIAINNSNFLVSATTGVKRRITIQGDTNGNLVATWYSEGKRVGITKTASDSTWTALPEAYFKPSGGIPESDLESGLQSAIDSAIQAPGGYDTNYFELTPDDEFTIKSGVIPAAVTANPTVPSGTTPTSLTGLKIGNSYYDIEAGGGSLTPMTNSEIDAAVNSAWV